MRTHLENMAVRSSKANWFHALVSRNSEQSFIWTDWLCFNVSASN